MMKTRFTFFVAALALGVVAPVSSTLAFTRDVPVAQDRPAPASGDRTTGSVGGVAAAPGTGWCVPSSVSEGNANQQTRSVKQYGQTTGGSRC